MLFLPAPHGPTAHRPAAHPETSLEAIHPPSVETAARSPLNGPLLAVLCLLFGVFGAHRFYAGRVRSGVLQLLTLGGLGVWMLIDLLFVLFGEFRDAQGRKVDVWGDFWKDF